MLILLKRWLAYLLIPSALVLLFFPFNTYRNIEVEQNYVTLGIVGLLVKENLLPVGPTGITDLSLFLKEQERLKSALLSTQSSVINSYGYPVIQPPELTAYPNIAKQISEMMQQVQPVLPPSSMRLKKLDSVQPEEWIRFSNTLLSSSDRFQYGNLIFLGYLSSKDKSVEVEIDHLGAAIRVVGGIALLLSFFILRGLYRAPKEGIQIGTRKAMIIWDFITILIGVFFASGIIDFLLSDYFQTTRFWGDDPQILFMSFFWMTGGNLIMAFMGTATALQSVLITAEGVSVKGLLSKKYLPWSDIDYFLLGEFYSGRQINGIFAPRKVAKIIKVIGKETTLRILEPPFAATKNNIITLLKAYAPQRLQQSITDVAKVWLSVW